jgi:hypothetical protein
MKTVNDIQAALNAFEEASIKHGEASESGDYRVANKNHDIVRDVVSFLKQNNKVTELLKFYLHPITAVRLAAATFLLPEFETESIRILEEIANGSGIESFDAEMVLEEWRNGNLEV